MTRPVGHLGGCEQDTQRHLTHVVVELKRDFHKEKLQQRAYLPAMPGGRGVVCRNTTVPPAWLRGAPREGLSSPGALESPRGGRSACLGLRGAAANTDADV